MQPILLWDEYNLAKIAAHGITVQEVEDVFNDPHAIWEVSYTTGSPIVKGYTASGRYLVVPYEEQDDNPLRIYPLTAFAPEEG